MKSNFFRLSHFFILLALQFAVVSNILAQPFRISQNQRFFVQKDEKPFFWQGDTAWLLFKKTTREEAIYYLDTRQKQGFNVAQVMVLHDLKNTKNVYGDEAVQGTDISSPITTEGNNFNNPKEYDYWDHVEFIVDEAAKRGIYIGMVPVWGNIVKSNVVSEKQAKIYAEFLANRFKNKPNIFWINGGDIRGDDHQNIWNIIGKTLHENDNNHLISFHPRGRTMSSEWFHNEKWLDFNMFQSGHRNYAQDNLPEEKHHFGEDNWRYAKLLYNLKPIKPMLDGEPSYENIPQGLHDPKLPRWKDYEIRRYAYWSVFAGGAGFTYGENSLMQFYKKGDAKSSYGAEIDWRDSINSTGANQIQFVKKLILSKPYFERVPANELVADQGERYRYIAATKGETYAFFYTYTGREFKVNMGTLPGATLKSSWFNPRNGEFSDNGTVENSGVKSFDPPGDEKDGNDWVLVLEK